MVGKKMNIIYIHSHDTGRYIQPYGYAVDTPNLQRLAEEGVLFRQAFNAAPTCSPSRACLLTGMAAHSNGMFGLAHLGWKLNDYSQHIIHTLHKDGYTSALSGIQHIACRPSAVPKDIGYHELLAETHKTKEITDAAIQYLNRDHDKPFFLDVGYFETHRPFPEPVDERDDSRYLQVPSVLADNAETRLDMAAFKTSARILDASIGRVLAALDEKGLTENTLIICTTDHGLPMPKMKCNLTDHGLGVMLILRGPEGFQGGKVIEGMVSHIDIFPTVCDLLGMVSPSWLQGKSFLPLVRGEVKEVNSEIFAEVTYHAAYEPERAVRTPRWKYIRRFDKQFTKQVLSNCDDSAGKSQLVKEGWANTEPDIEQLYDLLFDPQESNNLVRFSAYRTILDEMRGRLQAWMERTNDPLLQGPVEPSVHYRGWPQETVSLKNAPMLDRHGNAVGLV
jgi:arylsulfatase A-like enzyme